MAYVDRITLILREKLTLLVIKLCYNKYRGADKMREDIRNHPAFLAYGNVKEKDNSVDRPVDERPEAEESTIRDDE